MNHGPRSSRSLLHSSQTLLESGLSSSFLADTALARTWFQYSTSFSICMYLAALDRNFSRSTVGFLHRFLTKGPGRNAVIRWYIATAGSRFRMFNATFLKHSMKVHNGSFFSYCILMRAIDVSWSCRLIANCIPKWVTKVPNESTELGDSRVNQ